RPHHLHQRLDRRMLPRPRPEHPRRLQDREHRSDHLRGHRRERLPTRHRGEGPRHPRLGRGGTEAGEGEGVRRRGYAFFSSAFPPGTISPTTIASAKRDMRTKGGVHASVAEKRKTFAAKKPSPATKASGTN